MPICQPCGAAAHDRCDDSAHARLYRSCYCQHRTSAARTADPGPDVAAERTTPTPATAGRTKIVGPA